jgi:hypothetical protein
MSYVESATRDALAKAAADTQNAQRALILAAALLALLHVLTVMPYVQVTGRLAALANDSGATAQLSQKLEEQRAALDASKKEAGAELERTLGQAKDEMIKKFEAVDSMIAGNPLPAPAMAQQREPPRPSLANSEKLQAIVAAVLQNDAQAQKELDQYARENIVDPAYRQVNQTWNDRIRPALVMSIENAEKSVAEARALIARQSDSEAGRDLAGTLDKTQTLLAKSHGEIEKMELKPSDSVNQALGEEWWKSVAGKERQADAVLKQLRQQVGGVDLNAVVASFSQITNVQERARTTLLEQQRLLEKDLEEAQGDIASMAGSSAVVPIHAKTLISLFPLVLGLVLALMLFRIASCRGAAASAAADLAAVSTDEEARAWLMRQAEADPLTSILEVGVLPAVAAIWIVLAAYQINAAADALKPALPASVSALLGIIAVLVAASFDYANIRRLSRSGRIGGVNSPPRADVPFHL